MTYALLRVFYGIWAMGSIAFIALTIGTTMFSTDGWKKRVRVFARRVLHAFIWPIALMSAKGRTALLTDLEEGQK